MPPRWRLPRAWLDWGIDLAAAAFSVGAAVVLHGEVAGAFGGVAVADTAFVFAAVHGAVVLLRRRRPMLVLGVQVLTAGLYVLLGFPAFRLGPAVLFPTYTAAAVLDRRTSAKMLALVEASLIILLIVGPAFPGFASVGFYAVMVAMAWWLGDLVRRWRTAAEEHARRADELAATREELARYAVEEERRRIARDLHDVVAHSMTVVAMHAGTGRLVAADNPPAAAGSLATIERLSREALSEMRRLVGLLRDDADDEPDLAPAPGLGDLHRLVGEVVAAGLAVEVHIEGRLDEVPPGPALAAFRIIQEALTNAARHGASGKAELRVVVRESELTVEVLNDRSAGRRGAGAESGGMGLIGMRERVLLYHGTLTAGPLPGGGFQVDARFPLGPSGA